MATVTDLASVAAATAAGYQIVQFTNSAGRKIAILQKRITGESGTSAGRHESIGEDYSSATVARANALASLNAERRHRYAASPGATSGATTVTWPDAAATVPVVDAN